MNLPKEPLHSAHIVSMKHGGFVIYEGFSAERMGAYGIPIAAFSYLNDALDWLREALHCSTHSAS